MIEFEKLSYKNFLSCGNSSIEISLNSSKTTVLLGESGSGKSTILDAISFCLFNKAYRNINKAQLVNAVNNKDCVVETQFRTGGANYRVVRGMKPNVFQIYKNDVLLNQDSDSRDYQEFLETKILKCSFKTFSQIVVLGSVNFVPFMQLKSSDRRYIVEDLLGLEVFSAMNVVLKSKMSDLLNSIKDKQQEISNNTLKLHTYADVIKSLDLQEQTNIENLNSKIKEHKDIIELNTQKIEQLKSQISNIVKTMQEKDVSENLSKIVIQVHDINSEMSSINQQIKFYSKNNACNSCKQIIDDQFKKLTVDELSSKLKDNEEKLRKIKEQEEIFTKISKEYELLTKEKREHEENIYKLQYANSDCLKQISSLQEELSNLDMSKIGEKKEEYKKTCKQLISKNRVLKNDVDLLNKKKIYYEYAANLLKDSGIKSSIVKQYLPLINKNINDFLSAMNFLAKFTLDENFDESILTSGKDIFAYGNFSEGEKQRIDLALLFTWRTIAKIKNSVQTNLLIMDEVFDSYLDHDATENVIEVLKSNSFSGTNIFIISHKTSISDKFDSCLRFSKNKGFTKLLTD